MNEEQLDDLKQFIDSRISQTEARFDEKLEKIDDKVEGLSKEFTNLRKEMLEGFAGVGEAIKEINKHFDKRLTKLEQAA
ncbi:MAG TPA: hypothetical protein VJC09_02400 [Candidatus Saccharimonadales bacterium]|nr:hypothetical protein [Candidatus Saccharimonadales bacterium]